jgi:hypothetical protein
VKLYIETECVIIYIRKYILYIQILTSVTVTATVAVAINQSAIYTLQMHLIYPIIQSNAY